VYLVAAAAAAFWGPFATPMGSDLAGGVTVELSGVERLIFLAGRYLVLVVVAAFAVPLFLGGGAGPLLPDWAWVLIKTLAVLAVLVWARRRLPAARMDRFEEFAWVVLIPVTLVQLFVVCAVVLWTGG
jgi:NADH-quinone oxidoreductase subunit H